MEPFDAVKEKIKQNLLQERTKTQIAEFIDKAMKDGNTVIYPEILKGGMK